MEGSLEGFIRIKSRSDSRADGADATHSVGFSQLAYPPSVRAARSTLCQSGGRIRAPGIQSLGENLDGRLRLSRGDLLGGAGRPHSFRKASSPRFRFRDTTPTDFAAAGGI